MALVRIHVNRNSIRQARNNSALDTTPCISVNYAQKTSRFYSVHVAHCTAKHGKIMACGATAYLEADLKDVSVCYRSNWHNLTKELMYSPQDDEPNRTGIHYSIDRSTAREFAFDSVQLAINRINKIDDPAISIATATERRLYNSFEFNTPLQIVQSHPNLSSYFLGEILIFGVN